MYAFADDIVSLTTKGVSAKSLKYEEALYEANAELRAYLYFVDVHWQYFHGT